MKVTHPHDLAELRLWIWKQWQPGELFDAVAAKIRNARRGLAAEDEWINLESSFDGRALSGAKLYWVSPEMCALIDKASRTLPPTTLTRELMPSPEGLVWFEEPLFGLAAEDLYGNGNNVTVQAMLWGTSMIPPGPHDALGIASYTRFDKQGYPVAPAGRTDWEFGADSDEPIDELIKDDDKRIASMAEDRRWMATFWLLLSQPGMAESSVVRPLPKVIRQGKRKVAGLTSNHFDVRVVNVRAPKSAPAPTRGEGHQVDWSHRWVVQPFWRQQAYGPRHSLRRPTLVGPFVKGPADKPLIVKETVHVLKGGC